MVGINFRQAQEHQTAVMDCLEDPDDTLKLKTLELLYKMTKATNVEVIPLLSCQSMYLALDCGGETGWISAKLHRRACGY